MEKRSRRSGAPFANVAQNLAFVAPLAAAGVIAYGLATKPPPSSHAAVFDRVWELVSRNYYDETFGDVDWKASREHFRPIALAAHDTAELYDEAIWPMLDQIDASHVDAARPRAGDLLGGKEGHYSGRRGEALSHSADGVGDLGGLDAVSDGARWIVYNVRKGGEAERTGIAPGRAIASLSVSSVNEGRYRADLSLAGEAGQTEKVSYEYAPRAYVSLQNTTSLSSGVVVLRFDSFDSSTIDWALAEVKLAEPLPLILDLRENRGGEVDEMLRFVSAFLPNDILLGNSEGRRWPNTFPLRTASDAKTYSGPVAVLIGPKTASAGEITSYALQKHRNAPLVGERTAGAVLAARAFDLPDGGELMIATGNFTTADNQRIEGVGVFPTIPAAATLEAVREGRDLVIEAAERAVLGLKQDAQPPGYATSAVSAP